MRRIQAILSICLMLIASQLFAADLNLNVTHHKPCNLFWQGEKVELTGSVKAMYKGEGDVTLVVRDYFKKVIKEEKKTIKAEPKQAIYWTLDLGQLANGYYELDVKAQVKGDGGKHFITHQKVSFGVAPKVSRSAKEVRDNKLHFGLKMWYGGRARRPWDMVEALQGTVDLGLQWTRAPIHRTKVPATADMITKYNMNPIIKVESFPKELFDTDRYGPLEDWIKKNGRGWAKMTVPKKKEYQAYLEAQLKEMPEDFVVFELWNEPFNKMAPEDFAQISNMVAEVFQKVRPNAILGPNLKGEMSKYKYDAQVIKAGGMKGMNMVALHPYAGSENRAWMRQYKQWLKEQTGRDIPIYVTEYGSHSTPEGPARRSEEEQAQRVVRQTLGLYAEDVKIFTPHWMGEAENDPSYREDWYGFIRLNQQPKPVLMAYAACGRLIDGSNYVGDLWFGSGIGAMVFEKDQINTLVLYTKEGTRKIDIPVGVKEVELVDVIGNGRKLATDQGKVSLEVGLDPQYIVGIGPELVKQATKELNPKRWPQPEAARRITRKIKRMPKVPNFDGKLEDWQGMTEIALENPKVGGDDASGFARFAWDDEYLYIAINMRDNQIMNNQTRTRLYRGDSMELFVSTEPRDDSPGYGPHDHQFFVTPSCNTGKPVFGEVTERSSVTVVDVAGGRFFAGKGGNGWIAEVAIPWKQLDGFKPKAGSKLALEVRVNDQDNAHERFNIDPIDSGKLKPHEPTSWPFLILE